MDLTLLIWLFAGGFGLIAVLFILWWHHVIRCKDVSNDVAVIRQLVQDIRRELGDHDTGIRGQVHKLRAEITPYVVMEQMRREKRGD